LGCEYLLGLGVAEQTDSGEVSAVIFYWDGEEVFLQGFLRKVACRLWFFGGEVVVNCVVNVVV
jgi:hypothetical protein